MFLKYVKVQKRNECFLETHMTFFKNTQLRCFLVLHRRAPVRMILLNGGLFFEKVGYSQKNV